MATARQHCTKFITENNISVDDFSGFGELKMSLYSPKGKVFRASMCHTLVVDFHSNRPAGWQALWEDLQEGLDECVDDVCDTCHPED